MQCASPDQAKMLWIAQELAGDTGRVATSWELPADWAHAMLVPHTSLPRGVGIASLLKKYAPLTTYCQEWMASRGTLVPHGCQIMLKL